MKRNIITMFVMVFAAFSLMAQDAKMEGKEKHEERRRAMLIKQLDLTDQQVAAFTPIAEAMNTELKELRDNTKPQDGEGRGDLESISNAEASNLISKMFEVESQKLAIKKKYSSQFQSAIGANKTLRFFRSYERFSNHGQRGYSKGERGERGSKGERGKGFKGEKKEMKNNKLKKSEER